MRELCLITGSRGFLGQNLVRILEQRGFEIKAGGRDGSVPDNVNHIFDLASYGNLYHQKDFGEIYKANFERLKKIITTAKNYKSLIVVSTSSVKLAHLTFYAAAKLAGESLARAWAAAYSQPIVVVRPFSITGVGEQPEHLIPTLIRSCLSGEKMPFVPEPVHDFVDVEDVVSALLILAKNAHSNKGEIFEVGGGRQYSNEEIKGMVEMITRRKANIQRVKNLRSYDTSQWLSHPDKMWNLGWRPQKTIMQTIQAMVDYERIKKKNN